MATLSKKTKSSGKKSAKTAAPKTVLKKYSPAKQKKLDSTFGGLSFYATIDAKTKKIVSIMGASKFSPTDLKDHKQILDKQFDCVELTPTNVSALLINLDFSKQDIYLDKKITKR
jgi:hypothetical protein